MRLEINQEVPDIISRAGRTLELQSVERHGSLYEYRVWYTVLGQDVPYPCSLRQWLIWGGVLDG
jgi:hypothetical protein